MKPFLQELAERLVKNGLPSGEQVYVFPNRRAALFFQQYLGKALSRPAWSPQLLSLEEFIATHTKTVQPDRLSLIVRLHRVYSEVMDQREPFHQFYFWGDMLLRDFDEVDKYMVNAPLLFRDLSHLKELDESFEYLTEEQRRFLLDFWAGFRDNPTGSKEEFLRVWRRLPDVYEAFRASLQADGEAYEGMIHRQVALQLQPVAPASETAYRHINFVGFNALTGAEEILLSHYVSGGASVWWDADQYYVENEAQEAGQFLRSYRNHPILGRTFVDELPALLFANRPGRSEQGPAIAITGVPQRVGQAKLAGERLDDMTGPVNERTVLVLPDEGMLMPVLSALSPKVKAFNVTMGYSLQHTPLFHLLDLCIELQWQRKGNWFGHRQVLALLLHPYLQTLAFEDVAHTRKTIIGDNRIHIPPDYFNGLKPILPTIFKLVEPEGVCDWLLEIVNYCGTHFGEQATFDREYAYHFDRHLRRLQEVLTETSSPDQTPRQAWHGFRKLFRQVMLAQKIPFTGEPLHGLQIMGVLETRNLDFDHVHVLAMNEGVWPAAPRQGSYIPHSIRKAYALPTFEHQDAMYAYLFYRLLQRADTVDLYYNTEPDIIGNGEMSRYLQQLIFESGLPIARKVLHQPVQIDVAAPIVVPKTPEIISLMDRYLEGGERPLSPTALNDFVECSLRFYLKHLARLREVDEVEDDMDARISGNIIHKALHYFYNDECNAGRTTIGPELFDRIQDRIGGLIDRAFREHFNLAPDAAVPYEGERVIVRETGREFVKQVLHLDRQLAPFDIISLESPYAAVVSLPDGQRVKVGGNVDRVDRKGDTVRIIDYKTGGDDTEFDSLAGLFATEGRRNKAAFQTFIYAWIYLQLHPDTTALLPGLMNRKGIFKENYSFGFSVKGKGGGHLGDIRPLMPEFGEQLTQLLAGLYDESVPFAQTPDVKRCEYCAFTGICRR